jgi:hypothetical protein
VNTTWYFAEGRVGKGFREYLTIENPSTNACAVNIQYSYTSDSGTLANKTTSIMVNALSRSTESVNQDLSYTSDSSAAASVAAIVMVNTGATPNCSGVVAERPIYFTNFHGISSGTNVLGATHLSKIYFFADIPDNQYVTSYLTVFNPNSATANVAAEYYVGGKIVATQGAVVPAHARGTIFPASLHLNHAAVIVASDQQIMVEHPTYFTSGDPTATVNGASDVVGATALGADWLFAEGYTGNTTQEYLTLSNFNPNNLSSSVVIVLKSKTGATQGYTVTIKPQSQYVLDVNANNTFPGSSPEVSIEVIVTQGGLVAAQRQMYFNYQHTINGQLTTSLGGTDVVGQMGPASHSAYTFAEGYANTGYNDWLTIQNPTANAETIVVTLVNGLGQSYSQNVQVPANARYTEDLASLVQNVFHSGTDHNANAFSTTVISPTGAVFVAERPIYFNTNGVSTFATQGGDDIIGYVGG